MHGGFRGHLCLCGKCGGLYHRNEKGHGNETSQAHTTYHDILYRICGMSVTCINIVQYANHASMCQPICIGGDKSAVVDAPHALGCT